MELRLSARRLPAPRWPLGVDAAYALALRRLVRAWRDDVLAECATRLPALLADAARDRRDALDDAGADAERPSETGWAAALASLLVLARNRVLARMADARRAIAEARRGINAQGRRDWERTLRAAYGLDAAPDAQAAIGPLLAAWEAAAADAVQRLGDDALGRLRAAIIRAVMDRAAAREATAAARDALDVEGRADALARVGSAQLVGQLNEARQRAFGVSSYVWSSVLDNRTRPQHRTQHGRTYRWDTPPPGGAPGVAPRCRCWALPILPQRLVATAA